MTAGSSSWRSGSLLAAALVADTATPPAAFAFAAVPTALARGFAAAPFADGVVFVGVAFVCVGSVGWRTFEMLAAVGLINLSKLSFDAVALRTGAAAAAASALRARASDAAVGAYSPDDGSFGFGVAEGVFGREAEGVFARAGVIRPEARELGLEREAGAGFADGVAFGWGTAEVERAEWKEEGGGDFTGVRVVGFAPAVLGLPSRFLDGVTGGRAPMADDRPEAGFDGVAATFFF